MMKIGFVDYYVSEWHANNYPAWIADAVREQGYDCRIAYAWAELDVSPVDGVTTDQWCEQFGVTKCGTLQELCEKSDVILVLAPSDPDKHLGYAQTVLPYGKPTYIDKTFAPDLATAKKIFALAEQYRTPMFSTSALRFAAELDEHPECDKYLSTTGGGVSAEEYIIHQVEMVVKKLGFGANRVRAVQMGHLTQFELAYPDDRRAVMTYARPGLPFTLLMGGAEGRLFWSKVQPTFFPALTRDILRFFREKTVSFDTAQTLEVMRIRDGALRAIKADGKWLDV